jgi:hypothetical protein
VLAVRHCRRRLEVVRPRRQDPRPAEPGHHPPFGHHVLSAVRRRQVAPEVEPADRVELRPVVQHAPGDPRDLVGHPPLPRPHVVLRQVDRVGGVVQHPAVPGRGVRADALGHRPPLPPLKRRELRGAPVVQVRHPLHRRPDQPAPELDDRLVQAPDGAGLEPDVVVEEQRVPRRRPREQRGPVLRDAVPRGVLDRPHAVPARPQHPQQGLRRRGRERGRPVGLVTDQHVERVVLRREPGERRRQLHRPVPGGDENLDLRHRAPSPAVARIRVTMAVVEWSDR